MFYIGGAGKKKAVREILTIRQEPKDRDDDDRDDDADDRERPRSRSGSRSRSRSRRSNASGDTVNDDTDTDTDTDTDYESDADTDNPETNPDNNDYITTLGSVNTSGQSYRYSFTEEELDYDIEEFADQHPDIKEYQLVIYQINTLNTTPFLEFLFYYDKSDKSTQCRLPYLYHKAKQNIRKETDGIMEKLFKSKYRFKGFFRDDGKCFVFYEKYYDAGASLENRPHALISLQKSHNWFWVCTTEIIYQRKYMTIPLDNTAIDFFLAYPTVGILQATLPIEHRVHGSDRFYTVHIEAPSILYYGSTFCYAKNTAQYGLKREPIIARYGPFYYFTTLEYSYFWACYNNTTTNGSKRIHKRETGNGGISRYAVFTKRMKTAFIDDEYDHELVKKYTDRKNMFETKINEYRQNQEIFHPGVYDSIYSYDYSWTSSYDTIYNGYYDMGKTLRPIWCVCDHHNFELLSYYEVETDNIPDVYDDKYRGYTVM
jgi:hypothetical protein